MKTILSSVLGSCRAGDVLVIRRAGSLTNWPIERVQRRLLADLGVDRPRAEEAARFCHAGLLVEVAGSWAMAEMTSPRCRLTMLSSLPEGTDILVRRPRALRLDGDGVGCAAGSDASRRARARAAAIAFREAAEGRRYPLLELVSYWCWSWPCKLMGRKFREVFRTERADVCSGSVWRWLRSAGMFPEDDGTCDARPEAWYPARLAADDIRFRTVARMVVLGD